MLYINLESAALFYPDLCTPLIQAQCAPTRCLSSCEKLIFHFIEGLEIRVNAVALGKKDTYLLELEHRR